MSNSLNKGAAAILADGAHRPLVIHCSVLPVCSAPGKGGHRYLGGRALIQRRFEHEIAMLVLGADELEQIRAEGGGLGLFIRSLVGLDREAASDGGGYAISLSLRAGPMMPAFRLSLSR